MGCDSINVKTVKKPKRFNPRTHMGCDSSYLIRQEAQERFNPRTHMGCDCRCYAGSSPLRCFNPRTHMGCDVLVGVEYCPGSVSIHAPTWGATPASHFQAAETEFQSTHPHGVRLQWAMQETSKRGFNPRTHMGCDLIWTCLAISK